MSKLKTLSPNRCVDDLLPEVHSIISPALFEILPDLDNRLRKLSIETIYWLINSGNGQYINVFVLCAISYVTSRSNATSKLLSYIKSFLNWAIPDYYPNLQSLIPNEALEKKYAESENSRGNTAYSAYSTFTLYLSDFRKSLTTEQLNSLEQWFLPPLKRRRLLGKLRKKEEREASLKRKSVVHLLGNQLFDIRNTVVRRHEFLMKLNNKVNMIMKDVSNGEKQLPLIINIESIENNDIWNIRIWDHHNWIKNHQNGYKNKKNKLFVSKPLEGFDNNPIILQFVGDVPENGWFLKAASLRALQAVDIKSHEVRNFYDHLNLPHNTFINNCPGLVRLNHSKALIFRKAYETALGTKEDSKILFCLDELVSATNLAILTFFTLLTTGMRIGEFQQISFDEKCLGKSLFDYLSGKEREIPSAKDLVFSLFPKREEVSCQEFKANQLIVLCLQQWIKIYKEYHRHELVFIKSKREGEFAHARKFPDPKRFFLQWNGIHISSIAVNNCLKFLLLDHGVFDNSGKLIDVVSHIFRHETATELAKIGQPIDTIMTALKHVNRKTTEYYSQQSFEEIYRVVEPVINQLHNDGDVDFDEDSIRSPGDLVKILRQALEKYGRALSVPGGICANEYPCRRMFQCGRCIHNCPDPNRLGEVSELIQNLHLFKRNVEKEHLTYYEKQVINLIRDWEHFYQEAEKFGNTKPLLTASDPTRNNLLE